ncbi:hypothetical protein B5F34_08780 [Mediterranea sp. An20]|uniref:IS30 family transposase n=1 Tax=Mediterranea sp. An20 TaxID=1965586 RepID=UPI000B36E7BA|nr:IS30 family transposase [Mediterranea sp. An20]OUP08594.1 hypothetical protein B5F34_08780 [Mediterranea sp. An20]
MKKKNQLTREQRYQISALRQAGHSQKEIAEIICKDKSVISRELKRNSGKHGYHPALAQEMADERKERFRRPRKFTDAVRKRVLRDLCEEQYSPEQIVGLARREGREMVSHTRIYQFVREDKENGGTLYLNLRHRLKHRKRPVGGRCGIKGRVSIEERPAVVDARSRFGDWEIDTIVGKDNKGAIVTLTERKTGYLMMAKLPQGKNAKGLAGTVIRMLTPYKRHVHTITSDNGTEFAEHELIAKKLEAQFFFCHPYSSWERGLNEHTNGLVRQYIPKGEPIDNYDRLYIRNVQYKINKRPREKLGFDCPKRLFFAYL